MPRKRGQNNNANVSEKTPTVKGNYQFRKRKSKDPVAGTSGSSGKKGKTISEESKRGDHIINNGILKLFIKLIERFMDEMKYTPDERKAITDELETTTDFQNPLPKDVYEMIGKELVVNTDIKGPNDQQYGIEIRKLQNAFYKYMKSLYDEEQTQIDETREAVKILVEAIIDKEIYVDKAALEYWYKQDVEENVSDKQELIEYAKQAVQVLLRELVGKAETWVFIIKEVLSITECRDK